MELENSVFPLSVMLKIKSTHRIGPGSLYFLSDRNSSLLQRFG